MGRPDRRRGDRASGSCRGRIRLAGEALRILVQAAPPGTDSTPSRRPRRHRRRRRCPRPARVDADRRTWTSPPPTSWSASARTPTACSTRRAPCCASATGIDHATLQIEPDDHTGCDEVGWQGRTPCSPHVAPVERVVQGDRPAGGRRAGLVGHDRRGRSTSTSPPASPSPRPATAHPHVVEAIAARRSGSSTPRSTCYTPRPARAARRPPRRALARRHRHVLLRQLRRRDHRGRGEARQAGDRQAEHDRVRRQLPRPHPHGDGDDDLQDRLPRRARPAARRVCSSPRSPTRSRRTPTPRSTAASPASTTCSCR